MAWIGEKESEKTITKPATTTPTKATPPSNPRVTRTVKVTTTTKTAPDGKKVQTKTTTSTSLKTGTQTKTTKTTVTAKDGKKYETKSTVVTPGSKSKSPSPVKTSSGSGSSSSKKSIKTASPPAPTTSKKTTKKKYKGSSKFPAPDQEFYIYDKTKKKTYKFDGVYKVSHAMTLTVQEEPDEDHEWVNNARNNPNKVTFDVIMSDVYTDRSALTKTKSVRSVSAVKVLEDVKTSRRKVDVITNLKTYKDMLLSGIAITQDEGTTHFGWFGQLTFEEKPKDEGGGGGGGGSSGGKTKGTTSSKKSARDPSILVPIVGPSAI